MKKYSNDFWILFSGQTVSNIGDQIYLIALPWLVYELTKSTFDMGVVSAINAVPQILFAIFIGTLIDRYSRKNILFTACIVELMLIGLIPILYVLNQLSMFYIYAIGFFYSMTNLVFLTAYRSSIPSLVEKKYLVEVNSLIQTSLTLIRMIGPLFAGVLIANFGAVESLFVDTLTFVVLLLCVILSKIPNIKINNKTKTPFTEDMKNGFKYTFGSPELRFIIWLALVVNIGMSIGLSLMVFYLRGENQFLANEVGYIYSISGFVAFLMTLYAPRISKILNNDMAIILSCGISGFGLVLISYMDNIVLLGITLGLITGGGTLATVFINSTLQSIIPNQYLGRVFATTQMISRVSVPISLLIGGWGASGIIGINGIFKICGIFIILFVLSVYIKTLAKKENEEVKL